MSGEFVGPPLPRPAAVRLATSASVGARTGVRPVLGLAAWAEEALATAVLLEVPDPRTFDVVACADQIVPARLLPPGTLMLVLDETHAPSNFLARLVRPRTRVSRALRASALLARGYTSIGAGVDSTGSYDLVWGTVASR